MTEYSKLAALISSEFNKYLVEHEEVADKIPQNALVVFQVENERKFNKWSRDISQRNREKNQPLIFVNIKKWRQKASVEELDVVYS
ncbi:hypothetical protein H8E88_17715 [candidate division KSB1 bacterium]|nr:hypothetical protein [candidate division KSB1 bacterium]